MIYVTDTHPFVFYALGATKKLGRAALRVFTRAEKRQDTIYIITPGGDDMVRTEESSCMQ